MAQTLETRTVGELVAESPTRAHVMEKYGLDFCCGGKRPLGEACATKGLDTEAVVRDLVAHDAGAPSPVKDPTQGTLTELTDHIVATHHDYLREALPRLALHVAKVANAHGENHPEMVEVAEVFTEFRLELESHMIKEERILFPLIRALDGGRNEAAGTVGTVANPIRRMEAEHDSAGDAMETMRGLTHDYTPPTDACNTFRVTLAELAELEENMHWHVHKENNVLFPRAIATEAALSSL